LQESWDADGIVQGVTPESTLDLRGLSTGQASLLLLRNALDRLPAGQVLELRASQDATLSDLKAWLRLAGHEVIADLDASDHARLLVSIPRESLDALAEAGLAGLLAPRCGQARRHRHQRSRSLEGAARGPS